MLGVYSGRIYEKWKDFFIRLCDIECEIFDFKIIDSGTTYVIDETSNDSIDLPVVMIKKADIDWKHQGRFTFSDGESSIVEFGPFFESIEHTAVKKCFKDGWLANWVLESSYIDSLGWPDYLICFPLYDLYEGQI